MNNYFNLPVGKEAIWMNGNVQVVNSEDMNSIINREFSNIYVPQVEIVKNGMVRAYDPFSYLLTKRKVILDGPIQQGTAQVIISILHMLQEQDATKPIELYINSPGGSVTEGLAIYDTMRNLKCPVHTIGMGMCASMGSFLLSAGIMTGSASVLPNTTVMVHQVLSGFQGQSTDIDIHTEFTAALKTKLNAYYVEFIAKAKGIDLNDPANDEKIDQLVDFVDTEWERDWFISADDALKFGLVNKVIYTKDTRVSAEVVNPIIEKFKERRERRLNRGTSFIE